MTSEKIILFNKVMDCCGCGSCVNACPQRAIQTIEDKYGYVYPQINYDLCISCGLCKRVCRFQIDKFLSISKESEKTCRHKETYVAVSSSTDLSKSASGGLFAAFAKKIIENGGWVFGCALIYEDGRLNPKHIGISSLDELPKLLGSKYVQSDLGESYQQIKALLNEGTLVLFSGTPCQVAGLYGFLQKNYENLYTIDIICHGVPSVHLFHDYLSYVEKKIGRIIIDFRFRDKTKGWQLYGKMVCVDQNGNYNEISFEPEKSSYYQMFLDSYTYRKNCYECPYACKEKRPGDITIGDFWCVELVHPELIFGVDGQLDCQKGVSCLIINNEQGRRLLQFYGKGIRIWNSDYEKAAKYNGQLTHPSALKEEREVFLKKYQKGYAAVARWYKRRLVPIVIKRRIRQMIPRKLKEVIKNMR